MTSSVKSLLALTDDSFEQELLLADDRAQIDPDDELAAEYARASTALSNLYGKMTAKQRKMFSYLASGQYTNTEVAEKTGCSPQTVSKALQSRYVKRALAYAQRLNALQNAPAKNERLQMLWRIAKRNEMNNPNTSIKAIQVLATCLGEIGPTAGNGGGGGGVQINVVQFNGVTSNAPPAHEQQPERAPIEGEFTPVTVDV